MGNKISKSPVQSSQIKGGGSADGIEHTQAFSSRRGDLREVREAPVMPLGHAQTEGEFSATSPLLSSSVSSSSTAGQVLFSSEQFFTQTNISRSVDNPAPSTLAYNAPVRSLPTTSTTPSLFSRIEIQISNPRLSVNEITHTEQLAYALASLKESDPLYADLERLALAIVEIFEGIKVKTQEIIDELVLLVFSQRADIIKSITNNLVNNVYNNSMLPTQDLQGLLFIFTHARPEYFTPNDLLQISRCLIKCFKTVHIQPNAEKAPYYLLRVMRALFSLMGSLNEENNKSYVSDVSQQEWEKDFYQQLEVVRPGLSPFLALQLEYTQQSLLRITHDEKKLDAILRRTAQWTKGMGYLINIIQVNPDTVIKAYQAFCNATYFPSDQKLWYEPLQCLELLIQANSFIAFERMLRADLTSYYNNPKFVFGILQICENLVSEHRNSAVRVAAIKLLAEILQAPTAWGGDDPFIAIYGRSLLEMWAVSSLTEIATVAQNSLSILANDSEDNTVFFPPMLPLHNYRSTTLLIEAQSYLSNLVSQTEEILRSKKAAVIRDEELEKQLKVYISISIKGNLSSTGEKDAYKEIREDFLKFNKDVPVKEKVCLIQGDSGSGKSMFLCYLYKSLWESYEQDTPIPLLIHLPSIENPQSGLIEEALQRLKFDEKQINHLKATRRFIFLLDSYDEMKNPLEKGNLYHSNGLSEWKCQVVVSCRNNLLDNLSSQETQKRNRQLETDYRRFFCPILNTKYQFHMLRDRTVVPFNDRQINNYINKYLEVHTDDFSRKAQEGYRDAKWNSARTYSEIIKSISGLSDLVKNPFLLSIVMKVLPDIVDEKIDEEEIKLTAQDLYEEFLYKWFVRQENKLISNNQYPGRSMCDYYQKFAKDLASEMVKNRISLVKYSANTASSWEARFFSQDPQIIYDAELGERRRETEKEVNLRILARRACPLKQIAPNTYEFFHPTLRDHLAAEVLAAQLVEARVVESVNTEILAAELVEARVVESVNTEILPAGLVEERKVEKVKKEEVKTNSRFNFFGSNNEAKEGADAIQASIMQNRLSDLEDAEKKRPLSAEEIKERSYLLQSIKEMVTKNDKELRALQSTP